MHYSLIHARQMIDKPIIFKSSFNEFIAPLFHFNYEFEGYKVQQEYNKSLDQGIEFRIL